MNDFLSSPWPWYISGPLIGLMVPLLLWLGNKPFGISSSMRHICAACLPSKAKFFDYDWKKQSWNIVLVFGIVVGGFLGGVVFKNPEDIELSENAKQAMSQLGLSDLSGFHPREIFNWHSLLTVKGFLFVILGGFMVGFGTRYADGCTSGHAILGMSALNWVSLVATVCFFIGGLIMTHLLIPYILK